MLHSSLVAVMFALELVSQAPGQASSWATIQLKESGFRFSMPVMPQERTKEFTVPNGAAHSVEYTCILNGDTYLVSQTTRPVPVPPGKIPAEIQALMKNRSPYMPRLVSEKRIRVRGVEGMDFLFSGPSGPDKRNRSMKTHIFIKGTHVVSLAVKSGPDQPLPPETDRFLDSIRFGGETAAVTQRRLEKAAGPAKRKALAKIDLVDRTPEDALRTFLMAMVVADEPTLRAVTLPNPDFDWLLSGEEPPFKGLRELKFEMRRMPIERLKFGDEVTLPGNKVHVIRSSEVGRDRAALLAEGHPTHTLLRRIDGHWKVDATPIIAARKAADAARQKAAGN